MFLRHFGLMFLFCFWIPCGSMAQETRSCYTGPPGTAGVGLCRAGTQTRTAYGWSAGCEGEVFPSTDIPDNGMDEDCNGSDLSIVIQRTHLVETEAPFFSHRQQEIVGVAMLSTAALIALVFLVVRRRRSIRQRDIVTERLPRYTRHKDEV